MAMEGNQSMLHRALYLHPLEENYVSRSFPMALWAWLGMMVVFHSLCAVLEIFDRTQSLKRFRTLPAGDFLTYFEVRELSYLLSADFTQHSLSVGLAGVPTSVL